MSQHFWLAVVLVVLELSIPAGLYLAQYSVRGRHRVGVREYSYGQLRRHADIPRWRHRAWSLT